MEVEENNYSAKSLKSDLFVNAMLKSDKNAQGETFLTARKSPVTNNNGIMNIQTANKCDLETLAMDVNDDMNTNYLDLNEVIMDDVPHNNIIDEEHMELDDADAMLTSHNNDIMDEDGESEQIVDKIPNENLSDKDEIFLNAQDYIDNETQVEEEEEEEGEEEEACAMAAITSKIENDTLFNYTSEMPKTNGILKDKQPVETVDKIVIEEVQNEQQEEKDENQVCSIEPIIELADHDNDNDVGVVDEINTIDVCDETVKIIDISDIEIENNEILCKNLNIEEVVKDEEGKESEGSNSKKEKIIESATFLEKDTPNFRDVVEECAGEDVEKTAETDSNCILEILECTEEEQESGLVDGEICNISDEIEENVEPEKETILPQIENISKSIEESVEGECSEKRRKLDELDKGSDPENESHDCNTENEMNVMEINEETAEESDVREEEKMEIVVESKPDEVEEIKEKEKELDVIEILDDDREESKESESKIIANKEEGGVKEEKIQMDNFITELMNEIESEKSEEINDNKVNEMKSSEQDSKEVTVSNDDKKDTSTQIDSIEQVPSIYEAKEEEEEEIVENNITKDGLKELIVEQTNVEKNSTVTIIEIDDNDDDHQAEIISTSNSDEKLTTSGVARALAEKNANEIFITTETATESKNSQHKECINYDCPHKSSQFHQAPLFVLHAYNVNKRKKLQFVCEDCYEICVEKYENYAGHLLNQTPIFDIQKREQLQDCVEIIDSSDDEENIMEQAKLSQRK